MTQHPKLVLRCAQDPTTTTLLVKQSEITPNLFLWIEDAATEAMVYLDTNAQITLRDFLNRKHPS